MSQQVEALIKEFPEFDIDEAPLCRCLEEDYALTSSERQLAIRLLSQGSHQSSCGKITDEEWPGGYYDGKPPQVVPWGRASPFAHVRLPFEEKIIACRDAHNPYPGQQVHIGINAKVTGGRVRQAQATTKILGSVRYLKHADKRPGYVSGELLRNANLQISACVEQAVNDAQVPATAPILQSGDGRPIYWEYYSNQRGVSIYRDE